MRSFALIFACFTLAFAARGDNPGTFPFGQVVYKGNGCPTGSVSTLATEEALTVLFDSYAVESSGRPQSRYCHLRVPVSIPAGWHAQVDSVDYRGFVSLDARAWAFMTSWFRLGAQPLGTSRPTYFRGALEQDFLRRDVALRDPRPRRNCKAEKLTLHLFSQIATDAPRNSASFLAVDSADAALEFALKWERCRSN